MMNQKAFNDWLKAQPLDRAFSYQDLTGCVFAAFLNETNPGTAWLVGGLSFARVRPIPYTGRFDVLSDDKLPEWALSLVRRATDGHSRAKFFARDVLAAIVNPITPATV